MKTTKRDIPKWTFLLVAAALVAAGGACSSTADKDAGGNSGDASAPGPDANADVSSERAASDGGAADSGGSDDASDAPASGADAIADVPGDVPGDDASSDRAPDVAAEAGADAVAAIDALDASAGSDAAGGFVPCDASPILPASLALPSGVTLAACYHARGVQVSLCLESAPVPRASWLLTRNSATLYDDAGTQVGTELDYAPDGGATIGSAWQLTGGSLVAGQATAAAPNGSALTLYEYRAIAHAGAGVLGNVTFIYRLATTGGIAPAADCTTSTPNIEEPVDFTANYYFYVGGTDAGN